MKGVIKNPVLRSMAGEAVQEALQETYQGLLEPAAQNSARGGLSDYLGALWNEGRNAPEVFMREGLPAAVSGALMGGAGTVITNRGFSTPTVETLKPETAGTVPGNVAPQAPEKMSDVFKPAEQQPVMPETAKPLPGAMPAAETPAPTGRKAETIAAANMQKVAEMQAAVPVVEQPAQEEFIPEDTGETLDDLRAQMAEEYQNVRQMDAEEREDLPPSTLADLMEQSGRRYEQSPNVQDVVGRAPTKNKRQPFSLGADIESALRTLGDIHMANSGRDMMIAGEGQRPRVSREAEFLQSAREAQERTAQQLKAAGLDDETANAGGEIWANHLLARARALGTDEHGQLRSDALTPAELDKLNVRGEEDAGPDWGGDVYDQAVRDGLNMDERVPVVDLSGVADRAKGMNWRGLLRHLKSQIGQEPSISKDALAFLKIPANTGKLHHIAYSGAQVPAKVKSIRNASVLSLPELMRNAVYVEESPNTKTDKKPDVLKYHRFYVPVMINGKISAIRIVAEEKKTPDKLFPIDVDAYDVIVERKRTPSPKGDSAQLARRESSLREITIREMLCGVKGMDGEYYAQSSLPDAGTERERSAIVEAAKANGTYLKTPYGTETHLTPEQWVLVRTKRFKEWFGDWEHDPENASKVLDGNGEPLVVYHGSTHTGFSTFSTAGSMAYPGTGAFFSGRKDVAATYSGSEELVSREPGTSEPALSGEGVYPVFLNLRNPYRIDAEGKDWTNVGEISVYDNETGESVYDHDGEPFRTPREAEEYIERDLDDYSGRYEVSYPVGEMTTNEIAQNVGEGNYGDGFDGVIFENVVDEGRWGDVLFADSVYVAYAPNQIKAVDNRGTFSSDDANIYNRIESIIFGQQLR